MSQETILVVDDEVGARTFLRIMLERSNFRVHAVEDATSALEMLKSISPDLILLDAMLPDMNGVELCRVIREQDGYVPVVFVSARGDTHTVESAINAGATDYLTKPLLVTDFPQKLRSLIHRQ